MASKLLIVESPAKARTLSRYLSSDYSIKASMGHIRDLPSKKLAVDIDNDFEPSYEVIPEKKKTVEDLRKAAQRAETILLATDPDREGEAIAWHIAHLLGKKGKAVQRVLFHEITKDAVKSAIDSPGQIDEDKVDAQQARRVLDRLVGYKVSEQLWKLISGGLSAGRVQSVALRLIVERELEIEAFNPEEYWIIKALARVQKADAFEVKLMRMADKEAEVPSQKVAEAVIEDLKSLPARLHDLRHRVSKQKPGAPFTTSTLQQEASRRLNYSVKRTMTVAQQLYEGIEIAGDAVGLITYMRTDSTRVSPGAVEQARELIGKDYGENYLSPKPRTFSTKKGKRAQDAHEAIRPTDARRTPDQMKNFLKPDQLKLYRLIWNRFVATQMAEAQYSGVTVDVGVGELGAKPAGEIAAAKDQPPYILRALGRKLIFEGFRKLWGEDAKEEARNKKDSEEDPTELPAIFFADADKAKQPTVGDEANIDDVEGDQKFTQPPPRFNESSLVKMLDELGIGRPSTYAQIISTIQDRKYVVRDDKRRLEPTELGRAVNKILVEEFNQVFNVEFTAQMEEALDKVEEGQSWTETVRRFWKPFAERIEDVEKRRGEIKQKAMEKTGRTCPECKQGELIERWGRFGKFIGCERYPECKYIEKTGEEKKRAEPVKTGRSCPKCEEGELLIREGRNGKFIGCNRYPKCRHTENIPGEEGKAPDLPKVDIPCPREGCGGTIVAKKTRRGKLFYSCTNWKEKSCPVAFWDLPLQQPCPECDYPLVTVKGKNLVCPECKHKQPREDQPEKADA